MLRYALALPDGGECGDPNFLVELAVRAEDAGWDGVFLEDYICYQGDRHEPTVDVWTVLGAIAVKTERTILATSVTPLPRRRPWKVAREAAAIDQLSGGRFVLGVGIGDTGESVVGDASLSNFGEVTDARIRAEMLDEGLAMWIGFGAASRSRSAASITRSTTSLSRHDRFSSRESRFGLAAGTRCAVPLDARSAGMARCSTRLPSTTQTRRV